MKICTTIIVILIRSKGTHLNIQTSDKMCSISLELLFIPMVSICGVTCGNCKEDAGQTENKIIRDGDVESSAGRKPCNPLGHPTEINAVHPLGRSHVQHQS